MSLKDYLKETLDLGRDVFKVDVKEGFSFLDPETHTDKVMEVLNNVQLEGRRINVEISKMMVAEDVITTEEVLVVVVLVWKKFCSKKRRQFCTKKKVQAVVEATETQVLEGGFGGRSSAPRRRFWRKKFSLKRRFFRQSSRRSESFGDSPRPRRPRRD
jgi:ATP-dependent RNA helicase DeaD